MASLYIYLLKGGVSVILGLMKKVGLFSSAFFKQGKTENAPFTACFNSVKGFTLPELLLASAILAFALSSILLAFISCFFLNEMNRNLSLATTHGEFVLEEIKNTNFNTVKGCVGISSTACWDWNSAYIESRGLEALPNEAITTTVSGTTLLDIVVTMDWKDRGLRDRNVTLETLIAQP